MPRYFFNIVSGGSARTRDDIGEDFELAEAARAHARAVACELRRGRGHTFPASASVEVTDDSGKVIFTVPLSPSAF
jgi:hypothetical protein